MTTIKWPHPGEILLEEYLKPMNISQYRLAQEVGVPPRRINEIVKGQRAITADTALRLAAFFGTDAESWIIKSSALNNDLLSAVSSYPKEFIPKNLPPGLRDIQLHTLFIDENSFIKEILITIGPDFLNITYFSHFIFIFKPA